MKSKKSLFLLLSAVFSGFAGCMPFATKVNSSQTKEFVEASLSKEKDIKIGLNFAQNAAKLRPDQIKAALWRIDKSNFMHTQIEFSGLTEIQFDSLKKFYGSWSIIKSYVPFNKSGNAKLEDFLPPVMQAVVGLKFIQNEELIYSVSQQQIKISTTTNCWGTVWELIRHSLRLAPISPEKEGFGSLSVFYAERDMLKFLRDPQYSSLIKGYDSPEADSDMKPFYNPKRNDSLKPGDVFIITKKSSQEAEGTEQLVHAAMVLDSDLYFEKTAIQSNAAYRVTRYEDILSLYGISKGFSSRVEWRRFNLKPLPSPQEVFSQRNTIKNNSKLPDIYVLSDAKGITKVMQMIEVPIFQDLASKRGKLDKRAMNSDFFRISEK